MKSNRWKMSHPATMFFILILVVVFASWISDIYGFSVLNPATGEEIKVQSLLSPEGLRWLIRHVVTNFTGFSPLGMVMVAMFGIGVAEHSGFINACIRRLQKRVLNRRSVLWSVIFLGIISNVVGDAGYIILIPLSALLFQAVGMHPVAGIITAYVSVACGFSANLFISTLDPLLARYTQEAISFSTIYNGSVGALSNYWFMFVSTFLVAAVIYWVTGKYLLPALGEYEEQMPGIYKQLSRKERRALLFAICTGFIYMAVILFATFSPWGFLRGVTGGMTRSPFIMGALFLISLGVGLMGTVYGFTSGRYRSDLDVVKGLSLPLSLISVYFVIVFFASQMFACLEYSHLDKCLIIYSTTLFSSVHANGLISLLFLILFTALVNLLMVSSTAKWAFMSFLFVPMYAVIGVSPDWVQCAFRIGDSVTNAVTPFMFYLPLALTYMQRYDVRSDYFTMLRYTWRYSFFILVGWTSLFIIWYLLRLPLGL